QFQQADLRNREALAAAGDDKCGYDGEGQRDLDLQRRPVIPYRLQIDGAANLLDVGLDHIHANTAAGDVADLLRRGEPGEKNQVYQLLVRHAIRLLGADDAALKRFLLHPVQVDARAIVGNLDVDLSTLVIGTQMQPPRRWLARASPLLGSFNPVIEGIA